MAQPPPRFSLGTFDVGTILKPESARTFRKPPNMAQPPPGFCLGTFNVGTILKPKTFRKPPNMAQPPPRFSLGTFDVGTILKPESARTFRKPPPIRTASQIFSWNFWCWDHSEARTFREPLSNDFFRTWLNGGVFPDSTPRIGGL